MALSAGSDPGLRPAASLSVSVGLHFNALGIRQKAALRSIAPWANQAGFYLGGGTGVALHIGHRRSLDLDWFTPDLFEDGLVLARRIQEQGFKFEALQVGRGTLHGQLSGTRVSFLEYPYPHLTPVTSVDEFGFYLSSLDDLACMKLAAITQRGSRKDFLDIYALGLRHRPLPELLDLYRRKYGIPDVGHVLVGLTYFDDADRERNPKLLWSVNWRTAKYAIRSWVKELLKEAPMTRRPLDSASLKSVGYEEDTRVLQVEFQTGRVYDYHDVPLEVFNALIYASSHGTYFNNNIRGHYEYTELQ